MYSIIHLFLSAWVLQVAVQALQVTPGSPCAAVCLDAPDGNVQDPASSNTTPDDIVCKDSEYSTAGTGIKFKNCLSCLQTSRASSGSESDVAWFLYNLRYNVDVCMYGYGNSSKQISSPCNIVSACEPLKGAFETSMETPDNSTTYAYCDANKAFTWSAANACVSCLQASSDQSYISNFVIALEAGCKQKPKAGALLGLSGSLFMDVAVNITTPPEPEDLSDQRTSPMTTGAIVGIAVGAALLFLGGTLLFCVYSRKQKRLNNSQLLVKSDFDPRSGAASISPPIQGAFSGFDQKRAEAFGDYELRSQQAMTSNAAYYDSIEKELQSRRQNYHFDPNRPGHGPQAALPTHAAYIPQAMSRTSNSRNPSPQPPAPVKTYKADSYALEQYLQGAEGSSTGYPVPPAARPPRSLDIYTHSRESSLSRSRDPSPSAPLIKSPPVTTTTTQVITTPLPPPPPRQPKVPNLILPSVPRIKVPKKYSPPKIQIQDATPVADDEETRQRDLDISKPSLMDQYNERFHEGNFTSRREGASRTPSPDSRIVEQQVLMRQGVRPAPWEEVEIKTGKSSLYG